MQPVRYSFPVAGFGGTTPNIGTHVLSAGTIALGKAPSDANGGGLTIVEAVGYGKSGTCAINLVDMGAAGTATQGTVCSIPSPYANSVPQVGTPAGYWLDGGRYMGLEIGAGTIVGQLTVEVLALLGR